MKEWEKELYILQSRDYPHEDEPKFQSLVMLYLDTGDEKYFRWMLAAWEKKLNDIAMGAVQNYSMFGHFLDFKMTAVTGMLHALEQYDPTRGVPFEAFMRPYMKKEILAYVRTMRRGFTVPTVICGNPLLSCCALNLLCSVLGSCCCGGRGGYYGRW